MTKGAFCLVALALTLPLVLGRVEAQPPAGAPKSGQQVEEDLGSPIKVDVDVVNLYCSVRNKQNGLVNTLEKNDFDLAEDGKPQTIKYFSKETDIPLTI